MKKTKRLWDNWAQRLTQSHGPAAEVPGDSAAAAAVPLTDPALIQGVGGKQYAVTSDWLSRDKV